MEGEGGREEREEVPLSEVGGSAGVDKGGVNALG